MNFSCKIVGLLIVLSKPSDSVDQADSFSKSDKTFTEIRRTSLVAGPSILKLLATGLTKISKAKLRGQVSFSLSK